MRFRKRSKKSERGKMMDEADKLFGLVLKAERGHKCEIHDSPHCDRIGTMHILSKQSNPRLRYCRENVVLAGWFCSHFWCHHNPDDPRAIFAINRIKEIKGADYKEVLWKIEQFIGAHDKMYLLCKIDEFKRELKKKGVLW